MAFSFQEQQVTSSLHQVKLQELKVGESVMFFITKFAERTSEEFGEFEVCEGLLLDTEKSNNFDDVVNSAIAASFIPNTMLKNANLQPNTLYRIEKFWNRGDKGPKGNKAKGYGYKVMLCTLTQKEQTALRQKASGISEIDVTPSFGNSSNIQKPTL